MSTVQQLVVSHIPFANKIASRKSTAVPGRISRDEVRSAAYMGLVEAAGRFDPTRGVAFTTFAYTRICGAIIDYLRECGAPLRSLDTPAPGGDGTLAHLLPAREESRVEEVFEALTCGMDDRAHQVLRGHLVRGKSMREIGARLGVTESRVSQLISGYKRDIARRCAYEDVAA